MNPSSSVFWRRLLAMIIISASAAAAKVPDYLSPEQTAPGTVTFRYYAPNATAVAVKGLRGRPMLPMEKGTDGIWSVTAKDLVPEIYTYTFDVDGAVVLDPRDRYIKNWTSSESAIEVTGSTPTFYAVTDVEHGVVHHHTFKSDVAHRELAFQVYTPPGYKPGSEKEYPVIVLCHGRGDDERAWTESGRANFIADNLIAAGKMKPAIILMPFGHPVPLPLIRPSNYSQINGPAMEKLVVQELLPFVEKQYPVSHRAEDRAIAGLSMGGGHALTVGLVHPELFYWIGAFSSAAPAEQEIDLSSWAKAIEKHTAKPRLLWFSIGRDDAFLPRNEKFAAVLKSKNISYAWKVTDGGHEWPLWRTDFYEFCQLVFQ